MPHRLTGAGPIAVDAMKARQPMPKPVAEAMDEICRETRKQGSRVWIDAEQQALQPTVDDWAIDLMRKHNINGQNIVYNTIQAYLKVAKANVSRHIRLAAEEGWTVAIKLVRGAYIDHECRSLIHTTKEQTDECYDTIADYFISQELPHECEGLSFPSSALFLATHNLSSAERALSTYYKRINARLPTTGVLESGQIMGMADELSCALLADRDMRVANVDDTRAPRIFKCLTWGTVSECLGYLHRRAIENRDAVERTQHMVDALRKELYRRVFR